MSTVLFIPFIANLILGEHLIHFWYILWEYGRLFTNKQPEVTIITCQLRSLRAAVIWGVTLG